MAFAWFKDDPQYCLPVKDQDIDTLVLNDGYSQWLLGPGADFDLTEEMTSSGSDPADYSYVVEIKSLSDKETGAGRPIGTRLDGRAEPGDCENSSLRIRRAEQTSLVVKLPVRAAGLPRDRATIQSPPYTPAVNMNPDETVIIAIIDDSINIAHERFRSVDGGRQRSRVDFAWVQDGDAPPSNPTVPYGREWTRADIDQVLEELGGDEDALSDRLDLVGNPARPYRPSPLRLRRSHGTHVADIAAGYPPDERAGPNRRIVAVQLPALASQDTSGASLTAAIFAGLKYIFDRAFIISRQIGIAIPVIVNFSYGFGGGGRNSAHIVERAMAVRAHGYRKRVRAENLRGAQDVPVEFTLPAGNMALARNHAATKKSSGAEPLPLNLELRVQPEDRTSTFVELWLPEKCVDVAMSITLPDGKPTSFAVDLNNPFAWVLAQPGTADADLPDPATVVARLKVDRPNEIPTRMFSAPIHVYRILIALAPSLVLDKPRCGAPAGCWKIRASAHVPTGGRIEAWIPRDESILGMGQRGRQAYFEDQAYDESEHDVLGDVAVVDHSASPIKRDGSLSGIATAQTSEILGVDDPRIGTTVAGSYHWRSGAAATYSAAGSDSIASPHLLAVTDTSRILPGILAAGSRSGSQVVFSGTSMAAPQIARLFADRLALLPPEHRHQFDRKTELESALMCTPPRPDAGHPELASSDRIRRERTDMGLLRCQLDIGANIRRASGASGTLAE